MALTFLALIVQYFFLFSLTKNFPSIALLNRKTKQSSSGPPTSVPIIPNKDYNPTDSPTWKLLAESEPARSEEQKAAALPASMAEHQPIFSSVYAPQAGQKPVRPPQPVNQNQVGRSRLMPGGGASQPSKAGGQEGGISQVQAMALAQGSSRGQTQRDEPLPLYETNSIGGRRRIAQSSSFNKLMMNMLGE